MEVLKKAEMLPNFIVRLVFDNKEVRYYNLKKGETSNVEYWLSGWTISWIGHQFVIEDEGTTLKIDDKFYYKSDELYLNSKEHLN